MKSIYIRLIEPIRTLFNKVLYMFFNFNIIIFKLENLKVYRDSNGWFITYKYKKNIYKVVGPFIFLRPNFSLKLLKSNLSIIKQNNLYSKVIPLFSIHRLYIKSQFIENSISLDKYLMNLNNSDEKIDFFVKLFEQLELFHTFEFIHTDLKPKNILVSNNDIYFIDLENIIKIEDDNKNDDYEKLIPRIIYLLDASELTSILARMNSISIKEYIYTKYLVKYNLIEHLKNFKYIKFEKKAYHENEDIDIEIPSIKELHEVVNSFRYLNVDSLVFYCCSNDIKLYIYNQAMFSVIDIHLSKYLSTSYLFYLKLFKNDVKTLFISGPDGVGKTTLLNSISNNKNKFMYKMFNLEEKHGNRFVQNESLFSNSKLERLIFCKFFGCILKKNLLKLKFKLYSKSMLTIYDRSFVDVFMHTELSIMKKILIGSMGFKNDIILLIDRPINIIERKQELSISEIKKYYNNFNYIREDITRINVKTIIITTYKINSIIRYKLLTKGIK